MSVTAPAVPVEPAPLRYRWPSWAPRAAAGWSVVYAAVQLSWAISGTPLMVGPKFAVPPLVQYLLAVLALAAGAAGLVALHPRWTGTAGLILTGATAVFAVGTFGAPIEFVSVLGGGGINAVSATHTVLAVAGTGLLAAAALSCRRRVRGRCPRCGGAHGGRTDGPLTYPAPSTASVRTRIAVYAGMSGILPWAVTKTIWTLGGDTLGLTAREWRAQSEASGSPVVRALEAVGIDFTVLSAMLAWFLMLGLVYRWGQRFPRWTLMLAGRRVPRLLPLVPAWLTGCTLSLYGTMLLVVGLVQTSAGATTGGLSPWITVFGGLAFAGLGFGLLAGTRSYAARTRPGCADSR